MSEYKCSKHGNIGDPDCEECWENLRRLAKEKNAYISGDKNEI